MKTLIDTTRDKLRKLAGQDYIFPDNREGRFISFDISPNEDVTFTTSVGTYTKQVSEVPFFIERFRTPSGLPALPAIQALDQAKQQVDNMVPLGELADILMDSIRKVKGNKEYIEQARAINDQAKTLVDIAKVRVEALKVVSQFQSQ
ncbi:hypothetical protein [Larkinella terrae]|uniref:Uncharacterized protein n=1 Tax=Larkinella terrae TaxID=2025311 RepID=A0A7K0EJP7_9BACT|nr:hypothetical protein [Larkinella terrae]MRS61751.1 hypothetical protein [Larkinella terrae]